MAARTKDVDCVVAWEIGKPHRKNRLALTKDMRTTTKGCVSILVVHGVHTPVRDDEAVKDDENHCPRHRHSKSRDTHRA